MKIANNETCREELNVYQLKGGIRLSMQNVQESGKVDYCHISIYDIEELIALRELIDKAAEVDANGTV